MSSKRPPDFLVHDRVDSVGVVVVEGVQASQELTGWIMESDETIVLHTRDPIPLGHKLALRDIPQGADVIKYGHDMGRAVADIAKGAHAHVHNVKTKKW